MNQDTQHGSQHNGVGLDPLDADSQEDMGQRRLQQLLALLYGRWHWAILLALLLGGGLATAGYHYVTLMYRSEGQISIDPAQQPGSLAEEEIRFYDRFLNLQADRIRSQEVIEMALRHEEWRQLGRGQNVTIDDVRRFRRHLSVDRPRNTQSLVISFEDAQPEVARAGVTAIMDAYQRIYSQRISQADANRLRMLEQRRDRLIRQIESLEQDQARLLRSAGAGHITERRQHKQQRLWETETAIDETRRHLEIARATERGEEVDITALSVDQIARQDDQMRQLLNAQQQLQAEVQRHIELGLGRNHRRMKQTQVELDAVNRRIETYARQYREDGPMWGHGAFGVDDPGLLGTPDELEARLDDLQQVHTQLDRRLETLSRTERELERIQEELGSRRAQLRERQLQIEELEMRPSDAERLVPTSASIPAGPANDGRRRQLTLLGAMGGAGFGVGLVMLLGLMDRSVRRLGDAELALPSTRILGVLPTLPDARKLKSTQAAVAAHCVHHIRAMLQISEGNVAGNGVDHCGRVLTVTSPMPGAGKTSLVTALGVSFASSGDRTLLIDCDIVGGGLSRRLAVTARRSLEDVLRRARLVDDSVLKSARQAAESSGIPFDEALLATGAIGAAALERAKREQKQSSLGLFEVCEGEPFDTCIASTGVENLYLLPIGGALPEQAGSLSPDAVQRLLAKARGRFDVVLIDTGPILGSLEASMTAAEADDVVLVVSRGDDRHAIIKSIHNLHVLDANFAGLVFNHASEQDVHHSSYASVVPETVPLRSRPRHIDSEASVRFGPVGSAVASYSRQRVRGAEDDADHGESTNGDNGATVQVDGENVPQVYLLDKEARRGDTERRERRGRGRRADD